MVLAVVTRGIYLFLAYLTTLPAADTVERRMVGL